MYLYMNRNSGEDLFIVNVCILLFQIGFLLLTVIKTNIFDFPIKKYKVFLIIVAATFLPGLFFEVEWTSTRKNKEGFISGKIAMVLPMNNFTPVT